MWVLVLYRFNDSSRLKKNGRYIVLLHVCKMYTFPLQGTKICT